MGTTYPVDDRGYTRTPGASKYSQYSESWLNKARHFGHGPHYIKIGSAVFYSFAALDAWMAQHVRSCTRDDAA